MAYIKIMFQDSPSTATPLNAENLNHMDNQIALNDQRLTEIETSYVKSFNGRKGEVVPENGDYDIGQISPLTGAQVGQVPVVTNIGTEEDPELVFKMGAGGGGGHSIIDSSGNTMPQESAMQFPDSHVTDDETNGRTIVENIKEHTTASDYENATEDGIHVIDDGNDVPIGTPSDDKVEVVADGVKTNAELLNAIFSDAKFDGAKITNNSYIQIVNTDGTVFNHKFRTRRLNNTIFDFISPVLEVSNNLYVQAITLQSNNSVFVSTVIASTATHNSLSEGISTDGTKITLYYGTSSTVINLKTDANYCQYDANKTVKQAIQSTFKQFTFDNVAISTTRGWNDLPITLTADEISRLLFCNATVVESGIDIYQCYWKSTNNGVRVIGKAQNSGTYTIKVTIVFSA